MNCCIPPGYHLTANNTRNQLRIHRHEQRDRGDKTWSCWGWWKISGPSKDRPCTGMRVVVEMISMRRRGEEEAEVLPFRGRGFLRVHGHEQSLLAALWPRDHSRRWIGTKSCLLCFFFSVLLSSSRHCFVSDYRRRERYCFLLLLLLFVLFSLSSVSSVLLLGEGGGWGTRIQG